MSKGFFSDGVVGDARLPLTPQCGVCGLYRGCESPKMPLSGDGRMKILVIAEAPGEDEDEEGTQLVGRSGKELRKSLKKYGVDLDRDCWKTNAIVCHVEGNPTPTDKQIAYCRPNIIKAVEELKPEVVILLGHPAVKSLLTPLWGSDIGKISRWVGWQIPCRKWNCWICPTYHPAYLLRSNSEALAIHFNRHLEAAIDLEGEPWDDIPQYEKKIKRVYSPDEAAGLIRGFRERGGTIAFDYETTCLKPEASYAEIVSCSICWEGKRTIAYPWCGRAIEETSKLLRSDSTRKIASNLKFEERWTRKILGHGVRGWDWDTMQTAHVLDNRPGITGLKFQVFVKLGVEEYDAHIQPYLKAIGPRKPNRVKEIPLRELLLYGGMDSLLAFEVTKKQKEEMKG